jgi:hypothetical protein
MTSDVEPEDSLPEQSPNAVLPPSEADEALSDRAADDDAPSDTAAEEVEDSPAEKGLLGEILTIVAKAIVSVMDTPTLPDDGADEEPPLNDVADGDSEEPSPALLDVLEDIADGLIAAVDGSDVGQEGSGNESGANDEQEMLELVDVLDEVSAEIVDAAVQQEGRGAEMEHIEIDGEKDEEEGWCCEGDSMEVKVDYVAGTGRPPAPEEWEEVLTYARRKEVDALLADDYDNGRRYKRTEDVIRRAIHDAERRSEKRTWQDSIDVWIANLNRQIEEATAEWDEKINRLETKCADRRSRMESRHAEDETEFEEE